MAHLYSEDKFSLLLTQNEGIKRKQEQNNRDLKLLKRCKVILDEFDRTQY